MSHNTLVKYYLLLTTTIQYKHRTHSSSFLFMQHNISSLRWHSRGDYLISVAPSGQSRSVVVHHIPSHTSQCPFKKNRGIVRASAFHPSKPFLFVATDKHVRIYNLASQGLAKKLQIGGSGVVKCLDVHPSGDHVIVGMSDSRVCWFDLDLSARPFKSLRYHTMSTTAVVYHQRYPLFASSSGTMAMLF